MYPEIDYFIDETNNGWVNGVPARIANRQANQYINDIVSRRNQQPTYKDYLINLFNYIRQPREQRVNYFPYALGY